MDPKYLIISLDFDGCSDSSFSQHEIIQHIKNTCIEKPSIESIYVVIGSLRQTAMLDINNAHRNSQHPHYISCTTLYYEFLPNLHKIISELELEKMPSIHFCPLLMNDIYNHLSTGTTFQAMKEIFKWSPYKFSQIRDNTHQYFVNNQRGEKINVLSYASNREIADCSKVTIIYTQIHHFAKHLENAPILMHFFDDREDLLNGLYQFYTSFPELMPENLKLQLFCQRALPDVKPTSFAASNIQGSGAINPDYHELMYQMAVVHNWMSIPDAFSAHKAIFDHLLSNKLPSTHLQTFEIYAVPEPEAPKASSAVEAFAISSQEPSLEYHNVLIPDYLPENTSIFELYQKITSQLHEIYRHKMKEAKDAYESNMEFIINIEFFPAIFDLAFNLEVNKRQYMSSMEISQMQAELDDLIETHTSEFRLKSDCIEYATLRCNFEDQKDALKHAYNAAKHEKIEILAKFLQLPPNVFIERMERHRTMTQNTTTPLFMPKARRLQPIFRFNDDTQINLTKPFG